MNLFDVLVHPEYSQNQLLYLAYSARAEGTVGLEVLRARLLDNQLVDSEIVFRASRENNRKSLSGGRLLFMADGTLLVAVGDRLDGLSSAQDRSNYFGTVVRITDSGTAPVDNPFSDDRGRPEIYTFGHRNIQGIALDPVTRRVWVSEHGPVGGDELNVLRAGGNYGWPIEHSGENPFEGTEDIPTPGSKKSSEQLFDEPAVTWTPAIGPSGLAIYRGEKFPEWSGSIFAGSLLGCDVLRIRLRDDGQLQIEEKLLGELGQRIRDVRVGPKGAVYVLTDELDGKLISIEPLHYTSKNQTSTN